MLIRFFASDGKEREDLLARSLRAGAAAHGDKVEILPTAHYSGVAPELDVACAFGVKGHTLDILQEHVMAGKRALVFDKALIRPGNDYFRVGIDGTQPTAYLMRAWRPAERWERLGYEMMPRAVTDGRAPVIFAGSSQKYCDFNGLGDATEYAKRVIEDIRAVIRKREIIYRPKPSWRDAEPIRGTVFSRLPQVLSALLSNAHVLVTHGSAAAVEAVLAGVPVITLGDCAASPVSGTMETLTTPWWPSEAARYQWACQLAYCQWKADEIASGEAWQFLRRELKATAR